MELLKLIMEHPYATIALIFVASFVIVQIIKAAKGQPTFFDD